MALRHFVYVTLVVIVADKKNILNTKILLVNRAGKYHFPSQMIEDDILQISLDNIIKKFLNLDTHWAHPILKGVRDLPDAALDNRCQCIEIVYQVIIPDIVLSEADWISIADIYNNTVELENHHKTLLYFILGA
jgi:hypothetical protein